MLRVSAGLQIQRSLELASHLILLRLLNPIFLLRWICNPAVILSIKTELKLICICNPTVIKFLKKYDYFHYNRKFTTYFSSIVENLLLLSK